MFKIGDPVVHPVRGSGVVVGFQELERQGDVQKYYKIELLGRASTSLLIPVGNAKATGLRPPADQAKLKQVWRVLRADPETLPSDHKVRHKLVHEKLKAGNLIEIAEAVRDLAWRQQQENGLTGKGKKLWDKGMMLLTGEIAAAQGIEIDDAESQVRALLNEVTAPEVAT